MRLLTGPEAGGWARMLSTTRKTVGVVLMAATMIVASCSLPVDNEVQALDEAEYADIVRGSSTTSTTTPPEDSSTRLRLYYVVGQEGLGDVFRPLADPTIPEVLSALQAQPTEEEVAEYAAEFGGTLQTTLPAGLNPRALDRGGSSLLQIEVDDEGVLRSMPNDAPVQAVFVFSQIVCTVTSLNLKSGDDITEIEFHDSAGRIPIIDANQSLIVDERASRSDFRDCETVRDRREAAELEAEPDGETTTTSDG